MNFMFNFFFEFCSCFSGPFHHFYVLFIFADLISGFVCDEKSIKINLDKILENLEIAEEIPLIFDERKNT